MRASYQGSEILNEFPIKIAYLLDYTIFVQIAASRHYLSAKACCTVTHIKIPLFFSFFFWFTFLYWFTLTKNLIHPGLKHSCI